MEDDAEAIAASDAPVGEDGGVATVAAVVSGEADAASRNDTSEPVQELARVDDGSVGGVGEAGVDIAEGAAGADQLGENLEKRNECVPIGKDAQEAEASDLIEQQVMTTDEQNDQDHPDDSVPFQQGERPASPRQEPETPAVPAAAPTRSALATINSQFAPETRTAWSQLFGIRYEEESAAPASTVAETVPTRSPKQSAPSASTSAGPRGVRHRLDEQINRFRERVRPRSPDAAAEDRKLSESSNAAQAAKAPPCDGSAPLERVGLSLTQLRFCHERALDDTCRCFQRLHVLALDGSTRSMSVQDPPPPGIFVTQWELEQALRDAQITAAEPGEGGGIDPAYADVSVEMKLQAGWFLPFDELPRLRALVLQMTRRHLNERRLAQLNRHLRKLLLWTPHSGGLQQLLVGLSDPRYTPIGRDNRTHRMYDINDLNLVREFVASIDAAPRVAEPTSVLFADFFTSPPLELAAKWQLGSVVTFQRLVFFRYLVQAIAAERRKLQTSGRNAARRSKRDTLATAARRQELQDALQARSQPKSATATRKRKGKIKRRRSSRRVQKQSDEDDSSDEEEEEEGSSASVDGGHENQTNQEASSISSSPPKFDVDVQPSVQVQEVDAAVEPARSSPTRSTASQLRRQLEAAMTKLRHIVPSITAPTPVEPQLAAVKAIYLAATSFHQRVSAMMKDNVRLGAQDLQQLQHLVEALDATVIEVGLIQRGSPTRPTPISKLARGSSGKFPPPYPESIAENQRDDGDDRSLHSFPPPYVKTTPAFWTFDPAIDPPTSSIAKQRAVSGTDRRAGGGATTPRSTAKSPGVGTYDVRRSDRVTMPEGPSFSFGAPASISGGTSDALPSSSGSRQRVWKSSLAFAPPPPHLEDEDEEDDSAWVVTKPESEHDRIDAEAQCDPEEEVLPHQQEDASLSDNAHVARSRTRASLDMDMREALRLQQRMLVDDFLQSTVTRRQVASPVSRPPSRPTTSDAKRTLRRASSADTSRFVARIRQQRAAPKFSRTVPEPAILTRDEGSSPPPPAYRMTAATSRIASSSGSVKPTVKRRVDPAVRTRSSQNTKTNSVPVALPSPNGRAEPTAEHLAWATRVGELYAKHTATAAQ